MQRWKNCFNFARSGGINSRPCFALGTNVILRATVVLIRALFARLTNVILRAQVALIRALASLEELM